MTTGRPEPSPEPLRDPRFDAAWRAASREQPPAALDAAILGAARRAVGAGPQRVAVREATRPERWWWPLAAAASIGAVAIGILQLVATDRAGAPDPVRAIVSDIPAPQMSAAPPSTPSFVPAPAPPSAPPFLRSPASTPESAAVTSPQATGNAAARDEPTALLKDAGRLHARDAAPAAPRPAGTTAPAAGPAPDEQAAASAQTGKWQSPMPATDAGAGIAGDAAAPGGGSNVPAPARPAAPAAMPVAPAPSPAGGYTAASARSAQPFPANAADARKAERDSARAAALGKVMRAPATGARADERARERAPLPVPEWIALIRKLRAEGRSEELAREVAAFRAAYPDQQHLLVDEPSGGAERPPAPVR